MSVEISSLAELRERVIRYRAAHNLNQDEFAALCGLTRPTIGALESGGYRPGRTAISSLTWAKIVNFLDKAEAEEV